MKIRENCTWTPTDTTNLMPVFCSVPRSNECPGRTAMQLSEQSVCNRVIDQTLFWWCFAAFWVFYIDLHDNSDPPVWVLPAHYLNLHDNDKGVLQSAIAHHTYWHNREGGGQIAWFDWNSLSKHPFPPIFMSFMCRAECHGAVPSVT